MHFLLVIGFCFCTLLFPSGHSAPILFLQDSLSFPSQAAAKQLLENGQEDQVLHLIDSLAAECRDRGKCAEYISISISLSDQYIQEGAFVKAIDLLAPIPAATDSFPLEISDVYEKIGIAYGRLQDAEQSMKAHQACLALRKKCLPEGHVKIGEANRSIGEVWLYKRMDPSSAQPYFETALAILENDANKDEVALSKIYRNLGETYMETGDFERGIQTLTHVLQVRSQALSPTHPWVANAHMSLGNAYYSKDDYPLALTQYRSALNIRAQAPTPDQFRIASIYNNLGAVHDLMEQADSALFYYQQALQIRKELLGERSEMVADVYYSLAIALTRQKEFTGAIQNFEKAHSIYLEMFGEEDAQMASFYNDFAWLYLNMEQPQLGLPYVQKALISIHPAFNDTSFAANPGLSQSEFPYAELDFLQNKAHLLQLKIKQHPRQASQLLPVLMQVYQQCDRLIDHLRTSYVFDDSKLAVSEFGNQIYGPAIEASLSSYRLRQDPGLLELAFFFSEKSKAMLVYDAVREDSWGTPPAPIQKIFAQEKSTQALLVWFQSELEGMKMDSSLANSLQAQQYQDTVIQLTRKLDGLRAQLKTEFPQFYQARHSLDIANTSELRRAVLTSENDYFIEYHEGEQAIHAFCISKDSLFYYSIAKDSLLSQQIQEVNKYCSHSPSTSQLQQQAFMENAFSLYQRLLAPAAQHFHFMDQSEVPHLSIVPDGALSVLPFDVLLYSRPDSPQMSISSWDFLLKKISISYAWSASLLVQSTLNRTNKGNGQCLAFAYSDQQTLADAYQNLSDLRDASSRELPGSLREVQALSDHVSGDFRYGAEATEAYFKAHAAPYSFLHFAIHGEVNEARPMHSRLKFRDTETNEDGLLHLYEMYGLTLHAEMAILAACETGTGKTAKGEGVLSIARGFRMAGIPGIVMSIWKINDGVASQIMETFYRELAGKNRKDDALRQAKLTYLQAADPAGSHPFYWSGLIPMGNMEAPAIHAPFRLHEYLFIFGILLVFSLLLAVRYFKKRSI